MEDLATHSTSEEVAFLLLKGKLPAGEDLAEFSERLKAFRSLHPATVEVLRALAKAHPMFALEAAVAAEGVHDEANLALAERLRAGRYGEKEGALALEVAERLTAKLPVMVAHHYRLSRGLEPVRLRADLAHIPNLLYMMWGREPEPHEVRALEVYAIVHGEYNAPRRLRGARGGLGAERHVLRRSGSRSHA